MNKPLLLSLAAAALLGTSLNAESMYEKFQAMELQMQEMKKEIATLKAQDTDADAEVDSEEEVEADEAETSDDTEEEQDDKDESADEESEDDEDDDENEEEEEMDVEEEIRDMQESISDINKATNGNSLKLGVDYRFAVDNMQYKMANGDEHGNDAFMTNRLWINMNWAATKNLSFTGQLAYNKAFGQRSTSNTGYNFETFDWIANENAYDDVVRVRSAYFLYRNDTFFGSSVPWTFSVGRRPSTNGHLVSLRDDDKPASPMGHTINVEFDGLSSKFSFDKWVDGMYIKLCAGRGMSNAAQKFSSAPYSNSNTANPDIDLLGLIFVPYNNGQYGLATQYYYANNLIDQQFSAMGVPQNSFDTVGGLHSFTANFTVNGIGDEINDYLDDTFFFVSGAVSRTDPKDRGAQTGMLGSAEAQNGYSAWAGIQMPSFMTEDGRWGVEYNYGSKYWRSITYGEDTNIGSKLATRGSAYEAYFTEYLVEDILSLQIRYTYIDYEYSGSNGFFGNTTGNSMSISDIQAGAAAGNPQMIGMASQVVDTAQDIRFYLRYKY